MDNARKSQEQLKNPWWLEKAQEILETGEYSDLKIVIEYKDEPIKTIQAHKCLLHLTSPVWSSAIKWANGDELKITEYPYTVIDSLIKCTYINRLEIESIDHCIGVIQASDYYDMKEPLYFCGLFVQKYLSQGEVDLKDFTKLLNVAVMLNPGSIKAYCIAYIEDNTKQYLESPEFLESSLEVIQTLTRIQNYLCNEDYLIRAVLKWCQVHREDKSLRCFVQNCGIIQLFRWPFLTTEERMALIADYPDVFNQGESEYNLVYDPIIAANVARGEPNEQQSYCVTVRGPPFIIIEQFTYYGAPIVLAISSIHLAPRRSVIDHTVTKTYEDKFTIQIFEHIVEFDGAVLDSQGAVLNIPTPIFVPLSNETSFNIIITLQKTGVYFKNSNFLEYRRGLFRAQEGIIEKINSPNEEPSTSGLSHEQQ